MEETEYEKMYALEDTYWWFQGRKSIIFSMLHKFSMLSNNNNQIVVDLGCGTGLILAELNNYSRAIGVDFSQKALTYCQRRKLKNLVCANVEHLPVADESCDVILALDLLEHIEDDTSMMREINRICHKEGIVILTVPAYKFLWSEHDEALHHYRRYSAKEFRRLIEYAGFKPIKFSFCISFMYVPIVVFRKLQKMLKPSSKPKTHLITLPKWINALLIKLLSIEAGLLKLINFPFGVSLLCLARKK